MHWMSSSCSISRSLLEGKCNNENSCSGYTHTLENTLLQSLTHLQIYINTHTQARAHTLTLTLEGLQHGGVSRAQPRGVATHNPLQVVGAITEEKIGFAIAC